MDNLTFSVQAELTKEEINILLTCICKNKIYCIDKINGEKLKRIICKLILNTNNEEAINKILELAI